MKKGKQASGAHQIPPLPPRLPSFPDSDTPGPALPALPPPTPTLPNMPRPGVAEAAESVSSIKWQTLKAIAAIVLTLVGGAAGSVGLGAKSGEGVSKETFYARTNDLVAQAETCENELARINEYLVANQEDEAARWDISTRLECYDNEGESIARGLVCKNIDADVEAPRDGISRPVMVKKGWPPVRPVPPRTRPVKPKPIED